MDQDHLSRRGSRQRSAAGATLVYRAVRSYREGTVCHLDRDGNVGNGNPSWAEGWERMSKAKAEPRHVTGWHAGDRGSLLHPPEYQRVAPPSIDGQPPEDA